MRLSGTPFLTDYLNRTVHIASFPARFGFACFGRKIAQRLEVPHAHQPLKLRHRAISRIASD